MTFSHKLILSSLVLSLIPSLASADEPSVKAWAEQRVRAGLLEPLAERGDGPRFSRAAPIPRERRLRVVSNTLSKDKKGGSFASYEVDVRYGKEWRLDIVGCVYKETGQIFVKRGDEYRPAEFLLGADVRPVSGVCVAQATEKQPSDRA